MRPSVMRERGTALAGAPAQRVVAAGLDEEGVPALTEEFLATLRDGDAIGLPGTPPICECCWTEVAAALWWQPGRSSVLAGSRCLAIRFRGPLDRLVGVVTL
jgi:hypothetical protein